MFGNYNYNQSGGSRFAFNRGRWKNLSRKEMAERAKMITKGDIEKVLHLRQDNACMTLGISKSILKKKYREFYPGTRWPHRPHLAKICEEVMKEREEEKFLKKNNAQRKKYLPLNDMVFGSPRPQVTRNQTYLPPPHMISNPNNFFRYPNIKTPETPILRSQEFFHTSAVPLPPPTRPTSVSNQRTIRTNQKGVDIRLTLEYILNPF